MILPSSLLIPSLVLAFCFGCAVGSFLNVVVWRVPLGGSLLHPPSHCPHCGHFIRPWENIPIFSWLFLRGRCSGCRGSISIQYPLGEAATGILFLILWFSLLYRDLPLSIAPGNFYLAGTLLAIARIDCQHRLIPDRLTFAGLAAALFLSLAMPLSRPALFAPSDPHSGAMIFNGLIARLSPLASTGDLIASLPPIVLAAVDSLLGAGLGALLLTIVAEAGRRLMPAEKIAFDAPANLSLSAAGIKGLHGEEWQSWEEVLPRKQDQITILANKDKTVAENSPAAPRQVIASRHGLNITGQWQDWQSQKSCQLEADAVMLPREVMGYGDVKCLTMIGAFCGADATVYILLAASATAALCGLLLYARQRRMPHMIPFGPFLAAATLLWMTCGNFYYHLFKLMTEK